MQLQEANIHLHVYIRLIPVTHNEPLRVTRKSCPNCNTSIREPTKNNESSAKETQKTKKMMMKKRGFGDKQLKADFF